jgi:hypothetical protein
VTDSKPKRPSFVKARLFSDPTPNGSINRRILVNPLVLTDATDLNDEERERLLRLLTLVARKLASVWTHRARYAEAQHELVAAAHDAVGLDTEVLDLGYSQELFLEFEEFLVQVKSALDHLVKVPAVFIGTKAWSLTTWGDKGRKVEKAVKNNLPKQHKQHAAGIRDLVLKPHREWLPDVIEARDKVSHYLQGGVDFELFGVHLMEGGDVRVPLWAPDQTVLEFMDVIWGNLLRLAEDFVHVFLYLRVTDDYVFKKDPQSPMSAKPSWTLHPRRKLDALRDAGVLKAHEPEE